MKKDIVERTFRFAAKIISVSRKSQLSEAGRVVTRQYIRSGTSIGANVEEAQDASSKKEFISKMGIALKEARETRYWLRLLQSARLLPDHELEGLLRECSEICAILTSIVKNAKNKK